MTNNIRAIDLFCGVGGLSSGLISSGIDVVAGIDADPICKFGFEANHKNSKFVHSDISDISGQDLKQFWGEAQFRLLAGCAPCQPFSSFSQGKDHSRDGRWRLLDQFKRLVKESHPEFVTMENVPSLQKAEIFEDFKISLKESGYNVSSTILNCAEYGVPQKRHRLVLMASSSGLELPDIAKFKSQPKSVESAISKLQPLKAGGKSKTDPLHRAASLSDLNAKRIKASIPGGTWQDWPPKIRAKCHTKSRGNGYIAVYGRMTWEDPAPTITTQCYNYGSGRFGHPDQDRPITLREAALLQGFPPEFKFESVDQQFATRDIARMIGNAVPPPLGAAIGKSIVGTVSREI